MSQVVINWFIKTDQDADQPNSGSNESPAAENTPLIRTPTILNNSSNYFKDKTRTVDYVLVCNAQSLNNSVHRQYITTFIQQLEEVGFQLEGETGKVLKKLLFIKIHVPLESLKNFAKAAGIPLECTSEKYEYRMEAAHWKFTSTEIDLATPGCPLHRRAPNVLSKDSPPNIVRFECFIIIKKLLDRAVYSLDPYEFGIDKLLSKKVFVAAYPLHDGQWEWTTSGPLTERQLLGRFWARKSMWYKNQPLEIIKNYYGPEFAMHCALHGFFNHMLVYATIVGIICFLISLIVALAFDSVPMQEICSSNIKLCPIILSGQHRLQKLKELCSYARFTYLFDNPVTILYAIFMSFWATVFLEMWKRFHHSLLYQWNLWIEDVDARPRLDYEQKTKYRRVSHITSKMEPYVPMKIIAVHHTITMFSCLTLVLLLIVTVFCLILYGLSVSHALKMSQTKFFRNNCRMITEVTASIIAVAFIRFYGTFYSIIALWLTEAENPRTQLEFDHLYIYKLFFMAFVNNYVGVAYAAFVKGKLYTYPGDESMETLAGIQSDRCDPSGCVFGLSIQLAMIMFFKALFFNFIKVLAPIVKRLMQRIIIKPDLTLPQWEQDYSLNPTSRYYLITDYMELVMHFGFITSFVAAFPLAPFCALVNSYLEMRLFAGKYVRDTRRPNPARIPGIRIWNTLLQLMIYFATVCNAFIIAFTSNFTQREIYRITVDKTLKGYVNYTLSAYKLGDKMGKEIKNVGDICYYRGNRLPPDDPHKYEIKPEYWFELGMRFVAALIFEHLVLAFTGIVSTIIPDVPYKLRQEIDHHYNRSRENNLLTLRQKLSKSIYWRRFVLPTDV